MEHVNNDLNNSISTTIILYKTSSRLIPWVASTPTFNKESSACVNKGLEEGNKEVFNTSNQFMGISKLVAGNSLVLLCVTYLSSRVLPSLLVLPLLQSISCLILLLFWWKIHSLCFLTVHPPNVNPFLHVLPFCMLFFFHFSYVSSSIAIIL